MNLLQSLFNYLLGPEPNAAALARRYITDADFSDTVRSQALARFERHMALNHDVDESFRSVVKWAESVS